MKRILITGGCGFIGTNLTNHLLSCGEYEITLLDNLSNAVCDRSSDTSGRVRIIPSDIRDLMECETVSGQDVLVHLAAYTQVAESLKNPAQCFEVNLQGTINLLEACREHRVPRFIFASSNAAAGSCQSSISEATVPRPLSPYGATKSAGEALCSAYAHSYGISTVALRFSNVYGPYCQRKSSVIAKFMRSMLEGSPVTIYGDGSQSRDFVHVADLCQAIALCIDESSGSMPYEVFQVASGIETRVLELVRIMERVIGRKAELQFEAARAGEILKNSSNISRISERLGFTPAVTLEEGIGALYDWFQPSSLNSLLAARN
jgi:UDP-glucose 4-epimerase